MQSDLRRDGDALRHRDPAGPAAADRAVEVSVGTPAQMLRALSPGAIDMAGVIVVPRDEDFARVGAREAIEIFSEVSASKQLARDLAMSL